MVVKKTKNEIEKDILDKWSGVVKIGILAENNPDIPLKDINLAGVGMVMDLGSIVNNCPARPWLKDYSSELLKSCKSLDDLGKKNVERIKKDFDSGSDWAPNAPITLTGGWMLNKVSLKPFYVIPKKGTTPLTNTGLLKKSISYKRIKDKK